MQANLSPPYNLNTTKTPIHFYSLACPSFLRFMFELNTISLIPFII